MRRAQSGGVITYFKDGKHGVRGIRSRVVNGKRTDLAELLLSKLRKEICGGPRGPSYPLREEAWRLFQGHTRFARRNGIHICTEDKEETLLLLLLLGKRSSRSRPSLIFVCSLPSSVSRSFSRAWVAFWIA